MDKSTKKLKVFETSDSENKTRQLAIKKTRNETFSQPIIQNESHRGLLYDTSLECTLENMKKSEKIFETIETPEGDKTWNSIEDKKIGASRVEIGGNEYYISPELQEVFTNSSGATIQNLNIEDEVISSNISRKLNYTKYSPQRGKISGRSNYIKRHLDSDLKKIQNETAGEIEGQGMIILINSNIITIWTTLEVLLELTLSGHTDTLTEGSNLIDELYEKTQTKQFQRCSKSLSRQSIHGYDT